MIGRHSATAASVTTAYGVYIFIMFRIMQVVQVITAVHVQPFCLHHVHLFQCGEMTKLGAYKAMNLDVNQNMHRCRRDRHQKKSRTKTSNRMTTNWNQCVMSLCIPALAPTALDQEASVA